ncbi:uncharacterized protein LOC111266670 isoform X2 [Varroa jacobsoni]|uniref:uncharacterized protein LOC111266670 isoform X2 n=1 Tax=Varroa jacobsoni TaxID=62625 RepID=UPI000BF67E7F|nr:uncharacterized protein LOC111266670 isoform X2 [Varroa jacobsoni]
MFQQLSRCFKYGGFSYHPKVAVTRISAKHMSSPTPSQGLANLGEPTASADSPDPLKPLYISFDDTNDQANSNDREKSIQPATNEAVSTAPAVSVTKQVRTSEPVGTVMAERRPPFGCAICDRFASTDIDELEGHINAHRMDLVRHLHLHPVSEAVELATQACQQGQSVNGASRPSEWRRSDMPKTSYKALDSRNNSFKQGGMQRSIPTAQIGPNIHYASEGPTEIRTHSPPPVPIQPRTENYRTSDSYDVAAFQHTADSFLTHTVSGTQVSEILPVRLPPFHSSFSGRKRSQHPHLLYQQHVDQWPRPVHSADHAGASSSWMLQGRVDEGHAWAAVSERDTVTNQPSDQVQRVDQLLEHSSDVLETVVKLEYHEMQPSMSGLDHFTIDTATDDNNDSINTSYSNSLAPRWSRSGSNSASNNGNTSVATNPTGRQLCWSKEQQQLAPRQPLSPTPSSSRWDPHELRQFHQAWTIEPPPKLVICQQFSSVDWEQGPKAYCVPSKAEKPRRSALAIESKRDFGSTNSATGVASIATDRLGSRETAASTTGPVGSKRKTYRADAGDAGSTASNTVSSKPSSIEKHGSVSSSRTFKKAEDGCVSDLANKQLNDQQRSDTHSKPTKVENFTVKTSVSNSAKKTVSPIATIAVKSSPCASSNSVKLHKPNKTVVIATKSKPVVKELGSCVNRSSSSSMAHSSPSVSETTTNGKTACAPRRSTRLQGRPSRRFGLRAAYH